MAQTAHTIKKVRNRIQLLDPNSFTSNVAFMVCLLTDLSMIPECNFRSRRHPRFTTSSSGMLELRRFNQVQKPENSPLLIINTETLVYIGP
jgi:hypothetical protein